MNITIGNLIDQLSVTNIRIWMAEDIKRKEGATDKEIADATRLTNSANVLRNNLIQEIDRYMGIDSKQGDMKLYHIEPLKYHTGGDGIRIENL